MAYLDIIKINHWLNARKLTINSFKVKKLNLYKKLKRNKNFKCSDNEIDYLLKNLNVNKSDLVLKKILPEYIFKTKKQILSTKRPIKRDGIHFYNYYTLPSPTGLKAPVILDILCPQNKLPKLNNGHLEHAITINLGPGDIYGRWGKNIKKSENFSKISFNNGSEPWVIGDTYLEPTYLPHTYSLAGKKPSQILSYTAKSQLQKFVNNANIWSEKSYKNFIKSIDRNGNKISFLNFFLNSRGLDFNYISKKTKISNLRLKKFFNKKKIDIKKDKTLVDKICKLLQIDPAIFREKSFKEDLVGKTFFSFKESIKSIRSYKSYLVSSMSASERYPDLYGFFMKIFKKKKTKDLMYYASSHYLATSGKMKFYINNKTYIFEKGDTIWISPYINHGFSGEGSLIKISNGECLDHLDIYEINKIYNPNYILKRIYKDQENWGYDD